MTNRTRTIKALCAVILRTRHESAEEQATDIYNGFVRAPQNDARSLGIINRVLLICIFALLFIFPDHEYTRHHVLERTVDSANQCVSSLIQQYRKDIQEARMRWHEIKYSNASKPKSD